MDWAEYFKTHGDFVLEQYSGGEGLYVAAQNVLCLRGNTVLSVEAIIYQCSQHSWNGQIYEAWVYETKSRALKICNEMTGYEREALLYVINAEMGNEGSYHQAMEAINEARSYIENGYSYEE